MGVEWGPVHNGIAEVRGIPRPVLDAFSTRRRQITAHMAERGLSSARSAQIATYATRRRKNHDAPAQTLFEGWRTQAAALGVDARSLDDLLDRTEDGPPRPGTREAAALFEALAASDGITAARSTFTYGRLVEAVCDRLPTGGRTQDVLTLADGFLASEHVIALKPADGNVAYRTDGRPITGRGSSASPATLATTPSTSPCSTADATGYSPRSESGEPGAATTRPTSTASRTSPSTATSRQPSSEPIKNCRFDPVQRASSRSHLTTRWIAERLRARSWRYGAGWRTDSQI